MLRPFATRVCVNFLKQRRKYTRPRLRARESNFPGIRAGEGLNGEDTHTHINYVPRAQNISITLWNRGENVDEQTWPRFFQSAFGRKPNARDPNLELIQTSPSSKIIP